jgi:hypothetical protein
MFLSKYYTVDEVQESSGLIEKKNVIYSYHLQNTLDHVQNLRVVEVIKI